LSQFLDGIPEIVIYIVVALVMLGAYELGFRAGVWHIRRSPTEKDGPTGTLVGSLLALMAFLLAVTVGMAGDRFDTRRSLVQQEANAIGTTYLRAGYLPQPQSDQVRNLLRAYVPLRITVADPSQMQTNLAQAQQITNQVWSITEDLARANSDSVTLSLFISTVNDTIDLQGTRVTAINARVPEAIILFLILGSILAVGLVGYNAGLSGKRSLIAAVVMMILFSGVILLVIDLNLPTSGIFQVSQQPLITLEQQIGSPTS
jgi:hypothetical protein